MILELPLTLPFDAEAALGHLRAHAIPAVEVVEGCAVTRLIEAASGPVVTTVTLTPDAVTADIDSEDQADIDFATTVIRRWFDLEVDPRAVAVALGSDPVIGPLIEVRPGLRVIGSPHGFETAITTVLGQQVTLAAARTFSGRLVAAVGTFGPGGLALFPTADAIAAADPEDLRRAVGLTGARSRTLQTLARACASGLQLTAGVDPVEFRARLLALPGIGPWTADYLAVRVLGDRDAFAPGDLVLRRALGGMDANAAEAASEAWRPYRAYALFRLWTGGSYLPV